MSVAPALTPPALTALVHVVGFGAGAALYAMLGGLALRAPADPARPADRIPLATAALGVCWSVGALVLYPMRDLGLAPPAAGGPAWLVALGAVAFAALGFLPAVAVQAAAQPLARAPRRAIARAAYALSAAAAVAAGRRPGPVGRASRGPVRRADGRPG